MKYVAAYFCLSCDKQLSYGQMMDSHGVCPHCGAGGSATIVDCIRRRVPLATWWEEVKFWWRWL